VHLGIQAVVAASFARIHRQNLIAQGVVPLVFASPEERRTASVGDRWTIEGIREAIVAGHSSFTCDSDSGHRFELTLDLLPRERETLLAGGTLRYLRSSDTGG
jgi:aconitate hydratase